MVGSRGAGNWEDEHRQAREQRALAALDLLRGDRAPAHLRLRIERMRAGDRRTGRARRPLAVGVPATALAAAILAVILALPAGSPGSPSVGQAAQLALRGPAQGPPAADPLAPGQRLAERVGAVYFPNWRQKGWRASGERKDRLGGWTATTVYYRRGRSMIAYTILTAPVLHRPAASVHTLDGTEYDSLAMSQRLVVTWRRAGHTCVLSGRHTSTAELLSLASWEPRDPPVQIY